VSVDKRFEEDEFPVPAIAFEIRSSRSEAVTVTIVDEVPGDVAVEDLGFHPEYGSEYWTIDEDQITFERDVEANSEYTTVYGIRATGTEDVEKFLTDPSLANVDPPLEETDDSVIDGDSADVVRDVISGDSDGVPGLDEDDDDDEDVEDVETLDLKDPNDSDAAGADDVAAVSDGDDGESPSIDSLVGALATELRNGTVEEDDVKLLRKAFDLVDDDAGGSVDARIQRLQTDVADLLAYTDALEEFLDENGTAEQTIAGFREEVESLQSELQEVGEIARSHEDALSEVRTTVEDVESTVDSMEGELDGVLDEVDDVRSDVESIEGSVEDVEAEVDSLESQVGDIDVESVQADIDDIESDVADIKQWRDQLSSVIGGGD
jgi:outer membrane murein-binding lipoprotein Lpp